MDDAHRREREALQQALERRPCDVGPLGSPAEPAMPDPSHFVSETRQALVVRGDPEIREMPSQRPRQGLVLRCDRVVQMLPAPVAYAFQRARESVGRGLPLNHRTPLAGHAPEVREAEEIERSRTVTRWPRCNKVSATLKPDTPAPIITTL